MKSHSMRRIVATLAVSALLVGACGSGSDDAGDSDDDTPADSGQDAVDTTAGSGSDDTPDAGDGDPVRVALVLPSTAGDYGISKGVVTAMEVIQEERGGEAAVEIAMSENMFVVDDAAAAIRDFASSGFDVIIAASSAYGSSIEEIAPDFPDVSFVWGTNPETFDLPNVYAFAVRSEQGGYVSGVLSAMLADQIGFVGPIDVGSIAGSVDGFSAGAKSVNPDAEILENFTNSFSDAALASEAARAMVSSGVGVLASQTEMGVGVATVAEEEGIPFFGHDADFAPVAPTQTFASQVFIYEVAFRQILEQVADGTLGGEIIWLELANDGIEIVYNDGFDLAPDIRAAGDQAVEDIKSGAVEVTVGG